MELDLALHVDEPPIPTVESAQVHKENYEWWERSNHLILYKQKHKGSIPESDKLKTYMNAIEEQFVSFNKSMVSTLMKKLSSMKYDNIKGVHEHIMEMRDTIAKLKSLEIKIKKLVGVEILNMWNLKK
ncbi:hypothetical protein GmHk_01G001597 [Glycine max]|nr:hypothetical protein GmHk_01G001597 [Glycine max]